jgi:LysR family glycine cleavage system transcriptional activator
VRDLEHHLGFPLFERLSQGLRLTDMGRAYLPPVRKAFEDLSLSTAGLFGPVGTRQITIRATMAFNVLWLAPRLLAFQRMYPDLDIRLCSAVWADALAPDRIDLDIRLGHGTWPGYQTELITAERAVPACSRARHERDGPFRSPEDLVDQDLIHIMGFENLWLRFFRESGLGPDVSTRGITVDTALAAIELANVGAGHVMLLQSFTESRIVADSLAVLSDMAVPLDRGHYLLIPEQSGQMRAEVLLFREWLLEEAAK